MLGRQGEYFGRAGVDIFFVISGFIIARTSAGLSVSQFVNRRARRILPLYACLAFIRTVVAAVSGQLRWREFLATWFFWPATDRLTLPIVDSAWTLCFEALFYASFAAAIWRPKAIWFIGAAYLCALAFPVGPVPDFVGNTMVLEFFAGVALSQLPAWRPAAVALPIGLAAMVTGAILLWPPYVNAHSEMAGRDWPRLIGLGLPSILIVLGTIQLDAKPSALTVLGDASYALYLTHGFTATVLIFIMGRLLHLPADLCVLTAVPACLLLAWRVHELVEKPLMALWPIRPSASLPA